MRYKFLGNIATGDIAFEAYGKDINELFNNITKALCASMANLRKVGNFVRRSVKLKSETLKDLVYDYISEIVYLKDSEKLLFSNASVKILDTKKWKKLIATLFGEKIDPQKHELKYDIKSVTYHRLSVKKTPNGWKSTVVLDI